MKWLERITSLGSSALTICEKLSSKEIKEHPGFKAVETILPGLSLIAEAATWWSESRSRKTTPNKVIDQLSDQFNIDRSRVISADELKRELQQKGVKNPDHVFSLALNREFAALDHPSLTKLLIDQHQDLLIELKNQLRKLEECLQFGFDSLLPLERILDIPPQTENAIFFRKTGPIALDFDEGKVCRRPEVDDVKEKLSQNWGLLLSGNAASGKSVIAREAAYGLYREKGWPGYWLSVRQIEPFVLGRLRKELSNLGREQPRSFVVVEDVHQNPQAVSGLLANPQSPWPKILFTSRPLDLQKIFHREQNWLESIPARIDLSPSNPTADIMNYFFSEKGLEATPDIVANLEELSGGNLWVLSYCLEVLDRTRAQQIKRRDILHQVSQDLGAIEDKFGRLGSQLIIALSVLYRHEMSTDLRFLEECFKNEPVADTLRELVALGEATEVPPSADSYYAFYGLTHSALADLYGQFSSGSRWEHPIYLEQKTFLRNYALSDKAANGLSTFWLKVWTAEDIVPLDTTRLARRLMDSSTLSDVVRCIETLLDVDYKKALALVSEMDLEVLARQIEAVPNMYGAAHCIGVFQRVGSAKAAELVSKIDLEVLARRVEKDPNMYGVARCIGAIHWVDQAKAAEVAAKLDLEAVARQIDKDLNLSNAAHRILCVSQEKATELLEKLSLERLAAKINECKEVFEVYWLVRAVFEQDSARGVELMTKLNLERLAQQVEDIPKIFKAIQFIDYILQGWPGKGEDLIAKLNPERLARRIEKDPDMFGSAMYLEAVGRVDSAKSEEIVVNLDLERMARRIKEVSDMEDSRRFLEAVLKVTPAKGVELRAKLSPELQAQFKKE